MVILTILLIVIFIFAIWYISTFNRIKVLSIKIEESLSGIDVALAKRYDVLTKMVEVVKGYAKYENELLIKVIELRENMSVNELKEVNNSINQNSEAVNLVVERYPEIKANENFKMLQKSIIDVEEHLQAARRVYNSNVSRYNQLILTFPSSIVAKRNSYVEKEFFAANDEAKESI